MGNIFKKNKNTTSLYQQSQDQSVRYFSTNILDQQSKNGIKSTSTNIITFIPLNIIHQLKSLANVYFIIIAILQVIPSISVTGGKPTVLAPLSFVMITVLIKDAYQQFQRYLKDRQQNNRKTQVLKSSGFTQQTWENIKVGHIIKIKQDQLIPCDAIVLYTSHPQNKFFLQTKSLDGQTNLKVRIAPNSKADLKDLTPQQLYSKNYRIQTQQANHYLQNFQGNINIEGQSLSLNIDNLVLRGCYLRNVAQAICVCAYSGSQTKVILNSAKFNPKTSKLMIQISKMIISIFIWQVLISLMVALFSILFQASYSGLMKYIDRSKFWQLASSWWLIMTYFVPISLMVTMQMVKLFQGIILNRDRRGYVQEYDCKVGANNTSVNQNLGQIRYVFTDKTGTLTKNEMNFKKLIVKGKVYGQERTIKQQDLTSKFPKTTNVDFRDGQFIKRVDNLDNQLALKVIFLCHQIFVDKDKDGKTTYNSSSPDQIAFINFAKLCGKQFLGEERGIVRVYDRQSDTILKYQKLAFLQFDSDRKRMSVVIKNPSGQIEILTKGADSIIFDLLSKNSPGIEQTQKAIDSFSIQGLRTLLLAHKIISQSDYEKWKKKFDEASVAVNNRYQKLTQAYDLIEKDLILVGGTAVQDRLQDFVKQTIQAMKASGIKFYILTGDKKQTAISIGRSCGLIQQDSKLMDIPDYNDEKRIQWIDWIRKAKQQRGQKIYLLNASKPLPPEIPLHQTICYRCTPVQKQNIVKYVKDKTPDLTLAIGDGANDVNMITAADVGIGVKGKQGTQATRVSDFVVGQFSLLAFITLYYGRQWYKKNCKLVAYNFFKNWYHVACVIGYGAYTFFSATVIFDIYLYQLYNVFFVSLPIVVYAVFDQQYTLSQSLKFPNLYQPGLQNKQFNQAVYHKAIGRGVLYGFISLIIIYMCLQDNVLTIEGRMGYFAQSGAVLFANIIIVANLRILIISNGVTPFSLFAVYGSIGIYWAIYYLHNMFLQTDLTNSFKQELSTPIIYLVHLVVISLITFIDFAYEKFQQFSQKVKRLKYVQNVTKGLVARLLMGHSFGHLNKDQVHMKLMNDISKNEANSGNFLGTLLKLQDSKGTKKMSRQSS